MTDYQSMYGGGDEDESPKQDKEQQPKIDFIHDSVVIDVNGKKMTVVTREQYDRQTAELEKAKKQIRTLVGEIQQLKRVVNNISRSMVETSRDRFN